MNLRMTSHISPLRSLDNREILFITSIVHGLDAFDKKALFKHFLALPGANRRIYLTLEIFLNKTKIYRQDVSSTYDNIFSLSLHVPRDTEWGLLEECT